MCTKVIQKWQYGNCWHELSFKQAAHYHKVIVPFKVVLVVVDPSEIPQLLKG